VIDQERIKELARQAGFSIYPLNFSLERDLYFTGDHINLLYRLAELIEQECRKDSR
jgi:hypothetical protein